MSLPRDLRFAGRFLARTPAFTAIVLLVIAVGIGVNTAVFSVVDAVLLKPLTYPDPDALVRLVTTGDPHPYPRIRSPSGAACFETQLRLEMGRAGSFSAC